jgi:hypothetical protein
MCRQITLLEKNRFLWIKADGQIIDGELEGQFLHLFLVLDKIEAMIIRNEKMAVVVT